MSSSFKGRMRLNSIWLLMNAVDRFYRSGRSVSCTVSFSPTAVGFNGPAVAVSSNAVPSPRFFIISGEGVLSNPELDLMPDSIDFGNVAGDGASDAAV